MRHFIPEIWAAAVIAAAAALAAGRAALHPGVGRYALPLLGLTFLTGAAAIAAAIIAWMLDGRPLQ